MCFFDYKPSHFSTENLMIVIKIIYICASCKEPEYFSVEFLKSLSNAE